MNFHTALIQVRVLYRVVYKFWKVSLAHLWRTVTKHEEEVHRMCWISLNHLGSRLLLVKWANFSLCNSYLKSIMSTISFKGRGLRPDGSSGGPPLRPWARGWRLHVSLRPRLCPRPAPRLAKSLTFCAFHCIRLRFDGCFHTESERDDLRGGIIWLWWCIVKLEQTLYSASHVSKY